MDNEKGKITQKVKNFFTKKVFSIELDDAFIYPSSKVVIEHIEKYINKTGKTLEFKDQEKPITFYLDKVLYRVEIRMARGGYCICCKEV